MGRESSGQGVQWGGGAAGRRGRGQGGAGGGESAESAGVAVTVEEERADREDDTEWCKADTCDSQATTMHV